MKRFNRYFVDLTFPLIPSEVRIQDPLVVQQHQSDIDKQGQRQEIKEENVVHSSLN